MSSRKNRESYENFLPVSDDSAYINHIEEILPAWNKVLLPFGIKAYRGEADVGNVADLLAHSDVPGMLYPNLLNAFGDILGILLRRQRNGIWLFEPTHICISALTQSGKTTLINLLSFIPLVSYLLTGYRPAVLTRLLVNDTSLEAQADEEARNFASLYQHLILRREDDFNPADYINPGGYNVLPKTLFRFSENLKKVCLPVNTPVVGPFFRTSPSKKPAWLNSMDDWERRSYFPIVACDESHARCDDGSTLSHMTFETCHVALLSRGISFIGFSATNSVLRAFCVENGYPCVDMLPGNVKFDAPGEPDLPPIYTGLPWLNGRKIKNIVVPKIMSVSSFNKVAGCRLPTGNPSQILDPREWRGRSELAVRKMQAKRTEWINEFAKAARFCLGKNPAEGNGAIVRIVVNNPIVHTLCDELASLLPKFKVLFYTPEHAKKLSLVNFVAQECPNDEPYLALVTGRGRMGTVAPKNCRYAFDFCRESEPQTLEQGMGGRPTGYFKGQPWIILSDYNAKLACHYIETGKWERWNDRRSRWEEVSTYKKHMTVRSNDNVTISLHEVKRQFPELVEKIQDQIEKLADVEGKINRKGRGKVFPWKLLQPIVQQVEQDRKVIVDKPEQQNGYVAVNIRLDNRSDAQVFNTINNNADSLSKTRSQPVFVINKSKLLRCIRLRLLVAEVNSGLTKKPMYQNRRTA